MGRMRARDHDATIKKKRYRYDFVSLEWIVRCSCTTGKAENYNALSMCAYGFVNSTREGQNAAYSAQFREQ
jgi:hypothetical protein